MPQISVIVPVYNAEKYLNRCVDSILEQTYEDFELLLINDGSKDKSGILCDMYQKKDSRICVIHQENHGVSAARNRAVQVAKGKYVTYVDSDDWVAPNFLQVMIEGVQKYQGDICVTRVQVANHLKSTKGTTCFQYEPLTTREAMNRYGKSDGSEFRGPVAKLVKREIARNHPFPEGRKIAEDLATNYRYYDAAKIVVDNRSRLYFYYINQESVTNSTYNTGRISGLETLEELMDYFKKNKYPDLYRHYRDEYLYDVFKQYANVCKYIQDQEIQHFLLEKLRKESGLCVPAEIVTAEALIEYFEQSGDDALYKTIVHGFMFDLQRDIDKQRTATKDNALTWDPKNQLKNLLRKHARKCNITPQTVPEIYNLLMPKRMYGYWTIQGIKNKILKK